LNAEGMNHALGSIPEDDAFSSTAANFKSAQRPTTKR
jgi:hypothetical protein